MHGVEEVPIVAPATLRVQHHGYVLPNGLRCILVHDATATMAAAAMSVRTGKLNDPAELPGLAHFCEHMLFMGTDAYPREDEYDSYVSKHGGYANAWTSDDATTYYFRISATALCGALARFVQFFVAPRFSAAAMTRELQAVHSEDRKNDSIDAWRIAEVYQSLYHPRHPAARYGNGNLTTLHTSQPHELRDALLRYYAATYCANAACLVVYSACAPCEVLRWVCEPLSRMRAGEAVPRLRFALDTTRHGSADVASSSSSSSSISSNNDGTSTHAKQSAHSHADATATSPGDGGDEQALMPGVRGGVWLNIRTLRKLRQLQMLWPVRCAAEQWRALPAAYVAHVLGHECHTSVLVLLQQRGWATAVSVGPRRVDDDYELFAVSVSLTCDGLAHIVEVLTWVYRGLAVARESDVEARVYADMKAEAQLSVAAMEVGSAEDYCAHLATNANATDVTHALVGGRVVLEDDVAASRAYMAQLTPQHCVVALQWGELPCEDDCSTTASTEDTRNDNNSDGGGEDEDAGATTTTTTMPRRSSNTDEDDRAAAALFAALPSFAQVKANTRTRFHRTCYARCAIPAEYTAQWAAALQTTQHAPLALPAPNPYLTTDLTIFTAPDDDATATATAAAAAATDKCAGNEDTMDAEATRHTITTTTTTTTAATGATGDVDVVTSPHGITLLRADGGRHHRTFNAAIRWRALSPVAYASPLAWLYTSIMHAVVREAVTETSYYGELAALQNYVSAWPGGLVVGVTGPYAHLQRFFFAVLAATLDAATLRGTRAVYAVHAEACVRRLRSRASGQPYELASERFAKVTHCVLYTHDEVAAAAAAASYDGYVAHVQQYVTAGLLFECAAAGNMPSTAAMRESLVRGVEAALSTRRIAAAVRAQLPRFRDVYAIHDTATTAAAVTCADDAVVVIGGGGGGGAAAVAQTAVLAAVDLVVVPAFCEDNGNVAVVLALYAGQESARVRVLCDCAVKLLSSSFFNALRTREALGYVVAAASRRVEGAAYVTLTAQSALPAVDAVYLLARMLAFLHAVAAQLTRVCSPVAVAHVTRALVQQRERPPESVDEDAAQLQGDGAHPCGLTHRADEVAELRAVHAGAVVQFMRTTLLPLRARDAAEQQKQQAQQQQQGHDSVTCRPLVFVVERGRRSAADADTTTTTTAAAAAEAMAHDSVLHTAGTHLVQLPQQLPQQSSASSPPAAAALHSDANDAAHATANDGNEADATSSVDDDKDDEDKDDDGDDGDVDDVALTLPTFAQPTYVSLRVWESVTALQQGRAVLRSSSF